MSLMCFRITDTEINILSDSLVSSNYGTIICGFKSKVKVMSNYTISGTGDADYIFNVFNYVDKYDNTDVDNIINILLQYMNINKPKCESTIYISGYSNVLDKLVVYKLHTDNNTCTLKEQFTNVILIKPDVIDSLDVAEALHIGISNIGSDSESKKEACQLVGELIKEKDDGNVKSRVGIGGKLELTTITSNSIIKEDIGYLSGFGFNIIGNMISY